MLKKILSPTLFSFLIIVGLLLLALFISSAGVSTTVAPSVNTSAF